MTVSTSRLNDSIPSDGKVLVFDFDGTVCLGEGPVLQYAAALSPAILDKVRLQLKSDGERSNYRDGYELVQNVAAALGATQDDLGRAYLQSRESLATRSISAPTGLAEYLDSVRGTATIILATNAPESGIAEALETLGLQDSFDTVITSTGKPAGLEQLLTSHWAETDVLSIGDIWEYDLEPMAAAGKRTALIKSHYRTPEHAKPTYTASSLDQLYPHITTWLGE